jgi:hypothetical protein
MSMQSRSALNALYIPHAPEVLKFGCATGVEQLSKLCGWDQPERVNREVSEEALEASNELPEVLKKLWEQEASNARKRLALGSKELLEAKMLEKFVQKASKKYYETHECTVSVVGNQFSTGSDLNDIRLALAHVTGFLTFYVTNKAN